VLKPAHAITLHAILLLPGLAWLASHTAWDEARRFRVVALATGGYSLLPVAVGETLAATGPLRAPVWADALVAAGLLGFAAALPIHGKDGVTRHGTGSPLVAVALQPGVHLAVPRERTPTTPGVATLAPLASLAEAVLRRPRREGAGRRSTCRSSP
jgi:hypothetical protein